MKVTNKYNLPQPLVDAAEFELSQYEPSEQRKNNPQYLSVTDLITPYRIKFLREQHKDEIVEDVSDRVRLLLGTMLHKLLEAAAKGSPGKYLVEQRLEATWRDWTIGGIPDIYDLATGIVYDYKYTGTSSLKPDGRIGAWEQQLNLNTWLLRQNGHQVSGAVALVFLRDWFPRLEGTYPCEAVPVPVALWPDADFYGFLKTRVAAYQAALEQLPQCTDEERWKRTVYAVMKPGQKKSMKNCDTITEAQEYSARVPGTHIDIRPGSSARCRRYCSVLPFCEQGQRLLEEEEV